MAGAKMTMTTTRDARLRLRRRQHVLCRSGMRELLSFIGLYHRTTNIFARSAVKSKAATTAALKKPIQISDDEEDEDEESGKDDDEEEEEVRAPTPKPRGKPGQR